MGMTIDTIIKDCEQGIKQCELFIKAHQKNMEIEEIKEYQYCIERHKLIIDTMRKYQKIQEIINNTDYIQEDVIRYKMICEVVKDGNNN